MKGSDLLAGAAKAATYNMLLQLSLRIMTFLLNAFVLRFISRDMLGVVNVRLTLLYSTTLFLAKEAFDKACLSKREGKNWQQIINLMWCSFPVAVICCGVLGYVWIYYLENPDPDLIPHYGTGVVCFAISTVLEVVAEPLVIVGQAFMFVKLKVLFYGISQCVKCILTIFLVIGFPRLGILNFCISQIVSVVIYVLLYYIYFTYNASSVKKTDDFPFKTVRDFFPKISQTQPFIDLHYASLTWSFFKQSFLKQLLTEGEKFVMTFFDVLSFADQGIYDVINNLGSMAARFIFLPIEENGYLFFSQSLSRGVSVHKQDKESVKLCSDVLRSLLKTVTLIGFIILVFGFNYSYLALDLYGGNILTEGSGPRLLRWYCLYVLVIAVNGTTEGFVFAAMSKDEVDRYNHKMLVFSILFLFSSWFLTTLCGSVGFILANCFNMLARILHSVYFIRNYFKNSEYKPLQSFFPSWPVVFSLLISFIVTLSSEKMFCCDSILKKFIHIVIGGIFLLFTLVTIYFKEQQLVSFVKEQFKLQKSIKKDS